MKFAMYFTPTFVSLEWDDNIKDFKSFKNGAIRAMPSLLISQCLRSNVFKWVNLLAIIATPRSANFWLLSDNDSRFCKWEPMRSAVLSLIVSTYPTSNTFKFGRLFISVCIAESLMPSQKSNAKHLSSVSLEISKNIFSMSWTLFAKCMWSPPPKDKCLILFKCFVTWPIPSLVTNGQSLTSKKVIQGRFFATNSTATSVIPWLHLKSRTDKSFRFSTTKRIPSTVTQSQPRKLSCDTLGQQCASVLRHPSVRPSHHVKSSTSSSLKCLIKPWKPVSVMLSQSSKVKLFNFLSCGPQASKTLSDNRPHLLKERCCSWCNLGISDLRNTSLTWGHPPKFKCVISGRWVKRIDKSLLFALEQFTFLILRLLKLLTSATEHSKGRTIVIPRHNDGR